MATWEMPRRLGADQVGSSCIHALPLPTCREAQKDTILSRHRTCGGKIHGKRILPVKVRIIRTCSERLDVIGNTSYLPATRSSSSVPTSHLDLRQGLAIAHPSHKGHSPHPQTHTPQPVDGTLFTFGTSTMAADEGNRLASARVFAVPELTEQILGDLRIRDLLSCALTCKFFRDIIKTSKPSHGSLFWIAIINSLVLPTDLERFVTFDNSHAASPVYSFRMWQSSSGEKDKPAVLRFHECNMVVREPNTSVVALQDRTRFDLRRYIRITEDRRRPVEVRLKRKNLLEIVKDMPPETTIGEIYVELCEMSLTGIRSDFQQAMIN